MTEHPPEHLELLESAYRASLAGLGEQGRALCHAVVAGNGQVVFIPGIFTDNQSKNTFAMTVRAVGIINRADSVIFVSESWSVRGMDEQKLEKFRAWQRANPNGSFEDYPDHEEVLMIRVETHAGQSHRVYLIVRDAKHNPSLDEIVSDDFMPFDSNTMISEMEQQRLAHLLMPRELQESEKARAAAELYLKIKGAVQLPANNEEEVKAALNEINEGIANNPAIPKVH